MAYYYNDGQFIFDRALQGLWVAIKWLFKAVIFFPMLLAGYAITTAILTKDNNTWAWIGLVGLFAYALYVLVFFLKGLIIAFKEQDNLLWVLLFLICVGFTCVMPLWLFYEDIQAMMFDLSPASGEWLTRIAVAAIGIFLYSRYHFLTDIAPSIVYPFYKMGIDLGDSLTGR